MKIKKGQKVRVVAIITGHHFKIGEVVKATDSFDENSLMAFVDSNGREWFMVAEEFELIK